VSRWPFLLISLTLMLVALALARYEHLI